ncbi:type II secretion system protein [Hydrogenobacter sp. T-2]|uniref:GspH/FimT family pseudopilin n=1 Tax=Pampinifervens diazotrophicum TaxID=1632018 RepID=UPI002B25E985|nr:type II secretion system protein [Hydrogenobacter sp. T-2]WPM32987.1 type II secretion system protein [Hydrogenobacter sp. T-2]
MKAKGFSIVELLVVILIFSILASVSIPHITRYYRAYKYNEQVLQVESTLKWAKLIAMERGINTIICVDNDGIKVYNGGLNRTLNCEGQLIRTILRENFVTIQGIGTPVGFDPRGLAIGNGTIRVSRNDGVNACVQYRVRDMSGYIQREACQ